MREYYVKKTDIDSAQSIKLDTAPWAEYPIVFDTVAKMVYDDEAITVRMQTNESRLRAEQTQDNSAVCEDSCMEFFFKPNEHDDRYLNFEINPIGTLHLAIGASRQGREKLTFDKSIFEMQSVVREGIWSVTFKIPFWFIDQYTGMTPECSGNFYKCGDKTDHVHYNVWNKVETPSPDYHQSGYFGKLIFG